MLRVKLRCGDRAVMMAYTSLVDVLTAASDRLGCQTDEVLLKIKVEGDDELWEIEGEPMLKSAVEEGHLILAFKGNARPPPKKRTRTDNHAGPSSPRRPAAALNKPATPSQRYNQTSAVQRPAASAPVASSSAKSNPYLSSGGESADEGRTSRSMQRSSKRKWTEKEDAFLWSSLNVELKALPSPNPIYTRQDRRTVFDRIMEKHPRRFVGRTAEALRSRVRGRVLEKRKENKKLPARLNALFPVTRSWNTTPKMPQSGMNPIVSARDLVHHSAATSNTLMPPSSMKTHATSRPSSSRAASAPISLKRTFVGDVVRLRAIENAAASASQLTQSTSSGSENSSDEDQDVSVERGASSDINSPHTPSPGPQVTVRRAHVKTEEPDDIQVPLVNNKSSSNLSNSAAKPSTPAQRQVEVVAKSERTYVFCAPPFQPPNGGIARAEADIRTRCRELLLESPDGLLNGTPEENLDTWTDPIVDAFMQACAGLDSIGDLPATEEEVSYVVFVILDEIFRQSFASRRKESSIRRLACAIGLTFVSIQRRFGVFQGFDLLLCRFLRHTLFVKQLAADTCMCIAAIVLLVDVQAYESVLDGIFSVPWRKEDTGQNASSSNPVDDHVTKRLFDRMSAFLESLEMMSGYVDSHTTAGNVFRRLSKPPRFRANAWQRMFKETTLQTSHQWPKPNVIEAVRSHMLRWNDSVAKLWSGRLDVHTDVIRPTLSTTPHPSRAIDSPPARNTRSNNRAAAAVAFDGSASWQQQEPLFRGLPDFSQSSGP